ncbi:MAG: diaminopimelate decarboxylase [Methylobacterium sp.]|nr:diaminopimelate decarboxylase [Methylobacterium sp.]MCA3609299.1 diaminopimelate decarboxylase [Methylobacterium sp.]MCA3618364.1 diaminopimelate decarboxylase [Methylobacterium sp.]MCA3621979.1 diaminopimelate decarboxylase [Methylobacterium sp.]
MHHFDYRNSSLHAEGVDLAAIAGAVGTPVYVYSSATLERHYRVFKEAVGEKSHVFYAVKANGNLGVLMTLAKLGAGADTVSEGEIRKALAAGIPAGRIVFSGVGKSAEELAFAVEAGIYQVNVESEGELEVLSKIAEQRGKRQAIVLRVNPEIGAGGHAKITTGGAANKFGVSWSEAERLYIRAANMPGVAIKGLAVHIGSQIFDFSALEAAFRRMRGLIEKLAAQGLPASRLDLGGGVGVPYEIGYPFSYGTDSLQAYGRMVREVTAGLDVELGFEPGRLIAGNAGLLLTRALYLNERADRTFLVVDAAMNDLVRPAMYEAHHEIWPVAQKPDAPIRAYDVVGPICESSDTFAVERALPELKPGDLIAIMTAGAYGSSMSSTYNQRLLVPEVLVKEGDFSITRPRQTFEELLGTDRLPGWFA